MLLALQTAAVQVSPTVAVALPRRGASSDRLRGGRPVPHGKLLRRVGRAVGPAGGVGAGLFAGPHVDARIEEPTWVLDVGHMDIARGGGPAIKHNKGDVY